MEGGVAAAGTKGNTGHQGLGGERGGVLSNAVLSTLEHQQEWLLWSRLGN